MSDTQTSVNNDLKVKEGNLLEFKKQQSTDTDFYFNMLGNANKINKKNENSETSESENTLLHDSDTTQSSSQTKNNNNSSHKDSVHYKQDTPKPQISPKSYNIPEFPKVAENPPVVMSEQEIRMKKIELLRRLSEIKTRGYKLSKEYDFNSSIEEMQYEYDLLKSFAEKRNGIKIYKNILLNVTSAVEFLNDKYDPFDFHLSGWSEHLSYDIDSYDDVLEDLYEKYKGSGKKMPPEIKLVLLIIASASAFHFTKSQSNASKLNMDSNILGNLMNNKKESSQFMTEQEVNIEKLRNELKNKQNNTDNLDTKINKLNNNITQQQKTLNNKHVGSMPLPANMQQPHLPQPQANVPNIKAPENVKDILSRIHNLQPSKLNNNSDTQDESANNDRLVSDNSYSDSAKRKGKVQKKSNISIF